MSAISTKNGFGLEGNGISSGIFSPFAQLQTSRSEDAPTVTVGGTPVEVFVTSRQTFLGEGECRTYQLLDGDHRLDYSVTVTETVKGQPGIILDYSYTNLGDRPVWLGKCGFRCPEAGLTVMGDPADWYIGGIMGDDRIHPLTNFDENSRFGYRDFLTLYTDYGLTGLVCAPVGAPTAFLSFSFGGRNGNVLRGMECVSDMSYVRVDPGQTRACQSMALCVGPYDERVHAVFLHLADTHGCRKQKPPVGWCSWYHYFKNVTAQNVWDVVKTVSDEKTAFPFEVIQLDDGYQVAPGDWSPNEKFPGGMQGMADLAKAIADRGARPGIWMAPAFVHESTGILREHPDWAMRHQDGRSFEANENWNGASCALDFSNPAAYDFAMNAVRSYRDAGYTYFKIDFNAIYADGRCSFDDSRTSFEVYRDVYRGYRARIGEESYLNACSGFTRPIFGIADACRIGPDSIDIWEGGCSIGRCLRSVGKKAVVRDDILALDPDVSYLRVKVITPEEFHTWQSFMGLLGGLTFISDPIERPEVRKDRRQFDILYPPAPEKGICLHPGVDPWNRRLGFIAKRPWGDFAAAMICNIEETTETLDTKFFPFDRLGKEFHVWSFWTGEYLGVHGTDFPVNLKTHETAQLRLTPVGDRTRPTLIGSDLHISMGAAEIADVTITGTRMTIALKPEAGARDGHLYVYLNGRTVSGVSATGCSAEAESVTNEVLCLRVTDRGETGEQTVTVSLVPSAN